MMRTRSNSKNRSTRRSTNQVVDTTADKASRRRMQNNESRIAKKPRHRLFAVERPSITKQPDVAVSMEVFSPRETEEEEKVLPPPSDPQEEDASPPILVHEVRKNATSHKVRRGLALYAYGYDEKESEDERPDYEASIQRGKGKCSGDESVVKQDAKLYSEGEVKSKKDAADFGEHDAKDGAQEYVEDEADGDQDSSEYSEVEAGADQDNSEYSDDEDGGRDDSSVGSDEKPGGEPDAECCGDEDDGGHPLDGPEDEAVDMQDTEEYFEDGTSVKQDAPLTSDLIDASNILTLLGTKAAVAKHVTTTAVERRPEERKYENSVNKKIRTATVRPAFLTRHTSATSHVDELALPEHYHDQTASYTADDKYVDEPAAPHVAVKPYARPRTAQYIISVDEYDEYARQSATKYIAVDENQAIESGTGIQYKPYYLVPMIPVAPPPPPPSVCRCVCGCGAANKPGSNVPPPPQRSGPNVPPAPQPHNLKDPPLARNSNATYSQAVAMYQPTAGGIPTAGRLHAPARETLSLKLPPRKLPPKKLRASDHTRPTMRPRVQNAGYSGPYALPPPYPPQCLSCHSGYYPILNHPMYYAGSVLPPPPDYFVANEAPPPRQLVYQKDPAAEQPQRQAEESSPVQIDKLVERINTVNEGSSKPNGIPPVVLRDLVQAITKPKPSASRFKRWTKQEDDKLLKACEGIPDDREHNWCRIASDVFLGQRTAVQCKSRWHNMIRPGRKVGGWTKEEDAKIVQMKLEGKSWVLIAEQLPDRRLNHIRERWITTLDPSNNYGPWTDEEMKILLETREKIGNSWKEIAKLLPGRSVASVKNRYYNIQTSRQREGRRLAVETLLKWDWEKRKQFSPECASNEESSSSTPFETTTATPPTESDRAVAASYGMVPVDENGAKFAGRKLWPRKRSRAESDNTGGSSGGMIPLEENVADSSGSVESQAKLPRTEVGLTEGPSSLMV